MHFDHDKVDLFRKGFEKIFTIWPWKWMSPRTYMLHMTWQYQRENYCYTLTHWGRMTHICVSDLTIIGSDNGLSPYRRQAIIWTNAGILLIGPLETNFSEILIEILTLSFKKMRLKVSSAKRRPFCLGLNVLSTLRVVCKVDSLAFCVCWRSKYVERFTTVTPSIACILLGDKYPMINLTTLHRTRNVLKTTNENNATMCICVTQQYCNRLIYYCTQKLESTVSAIGIGFHGDHTSPSFVRSVSSPCKSTKDFSDEWSATNHAFNRDQLYGKPCIILHL